MTDQTADSATSSTPFSRPPLARVSLMIAMLAAVGVSVGGAMIPGVRLALALVLLIGFLFLVVSARYPVALLFTVLLYEALLSWREAEQIQILGYNRLLFYAVTVGTFMLALFYVVVLRKRHIRLRGIDLSLALYAAAVVLTAVTAHDPVAARSALTYLLATISILYTTRLVIRSERALNYLLAFLMSLMLLEALLGVAQFVTGRGVLLVSSETGGALFRRATGTLGNGLGWYLDVGFILAFAIWYFGRRGVIGRRYLLIVVVIGAGLLVANTRGAWVDASLAAALVLLVGLGRHLKVPRNRLLLLILLGAGALGLILFSSGLQTRVFSIWDQVWNPGQSTVGFRYYLWEAAVAMFRASPLLGVGPDNFRLLLASFATPEATDFLRLELGRTYSPHHAGLQILAESGLVGATSFALFLLLYLREAWGVFQRLRSTQPGLAAALWVFAVTSTLSILYGGYAYGGYTQVGGLFFVLVAVTLAQADLLRSGRGKAS